MSFKPTVFAGLLARGFEPCDYIPVAASQTTKLLGTSGAAKGNFLKGILIIPATTSPGAVALVDGVSPATPVTTTIFTGGASSVSNLAPLWVPVGAVSNVAGGWQLTTGANVSVIAVGLFT
jgi:hypothetical protein